MAVPFAPFKGFAKLFLLFAQFLAQFGSPGLLSLRLPDLAYGVLYGRVGALKDFPGLVAGLADDLAALLAQGLGVVAVFFDYLVEPFLLLVDFAALVFPGSPVAR